MAEERELDQSTEDQDALTAERITKIISNVFDKETIAAITKNYFDHQNQKSANEIKLNEQRIQASESNSRYFIIKYWQDILMVASILASIGLMAHFGLLETSTTGTLMGSVIGYALGQFKERFRPRG